MKYDSLILTSGGYIKVKDLKKNEILATDKRIFNQESLMKEKEPTDVFDSGSSGHITSTKKFIRIETESGFFVDLNEEEFVILEPKPFQQEKVKVKDVKVGMPLTLQSGRGCFLESNSTFNSGMMLGVLHACLQIQDLGDGIKTKWVSSRMALSKSAIMPRVRAVGAKILRDTFGNDYPFEKETDAALFLADMKYRDWLFDVKDRDRVPTLVFKESSLFVDGYLSAIFSILGTYVKSELEDKELNDSHLICSNKINFLHDLQKLLLNIGIFSHQIRIENSSKIGLGKRLYIDNKIEHALTIDGPSQKYLHKEITVPGVKKPDHFHFDIRCRIHTSKVTKCEVLGFFEDYQLKEVTKSVIIDGFNVFLN